MSRITDVKMSVGSPPPPSSLGLRGEEWTSFQFHIHDFADLDTPKDNYIESPEFTCNGHQWQLEVYPGGDEEATEGYVSAYLRHLSEGTITVTYQIDIMDKFGTSVKDDIALCEKYLPSLNDWGWANFIARTDIVDESQNILDSNGTLTIVISIAKQSTPAFVPENPFLKMVKQVFKFNDETTADVCFEVVSDADQERGKRKKVSVSFHAHRSILTKCAPVLADLFGSNDTATVTDVKPEIFHHLLYYVYGKDIPEEDLKTHAKDIIDAADKYAIVNLKLAAEAAYVQSTDITFDNAIDDLLYADSKNCALLKEKVMQFLADNHLEAAEKISFTECPGHVMKDLLIAVGRNSKKGDDDDTLDELNNLCVIELRRKLTKLGLEVDGSREAMIEAIKSHSSENAIDLTDS